MYGSPHRITKHHHSTFGQGICCIQKHGQLMSHYMFSLGIVMGKDNFSMNDNVLMVYFLTVTYNFFFKVVNQLLH